MYNYIYLKVYKLLVDIGIDKNSLNKDTKIGLSDNSIDLISFEKISFIISFEEEFNINIDI